MLEHLQRTTILIASMQVHRWQNVMAAGTALLVEKVEADPSSVNSVKVTELCKAADVAEEIMFQDSLHVTIVATVVPIPQHLVAHELVPLQPLLVVLGAELVNEHVDAAIDLALLR